MDLRIRGSALETIDVLTPRLFSSSTIYQLDVRESVHRAVLWRGKILTDLDRFGEGHVPFITLKSTQQRRSELVEDTVNV